MASTIVGIARVRRSTVRTGARAGRYSILLRATFQSRERTLREDEVAQWSAQIVKALEKMGGTLRA